jgi:hypothetical protein
MIIVIFHHAAHKDMTFPIECRFTEFSDDGAIDGLAVTLVAIKGKKATGPDFRQQNQITGGCLVDQPERMRYIFFFGLIGHRQLDASDYHMVKPSGMLEYRNNGCITIDLLGQWQISVEKHF